MQSYDSKRWIVGTCIAVLMGLTAQLVGSLIWAVELKTKYTNLEGTITRIEQKVDRLSLLDTHEYRITSLDTRVTKLENKP